MNLSLRNQLMIVGLAFVAFVVACSGNGAPATITPDPTNPMNPMGHRVAPTVQHSTSAPRVRQL